jgi:4-hydroxy-tetrahydrodipicolinate synthase
LSTVQPGPDLTQHHQRISDATRLLIVPQDHSVVNGATVSPRTTADLVIAVPSTTTSKLEVMPTTQRTAQTLARLNGNDVTILGGLGGMCLLEELWRGSAGTMIGLAYPEVLIRAWEAWDSGDREEAAEVPYLLIILEPGTT